MSVRPQVIKGEGFPKEEFRGRETPGKWKCDGSGHDKGTGSDGGQGGQERTTMENTDLQTKVGLNHHRKLQFFHVLANKQSLKSAEQVCSRSKSRIMINKNDSIRKDKINLKKLFLNSHQSRFEDSVSVLGR